MHMKPLYPLLVVCALAFGACLKIQDEEVPERYHAKTILVQNIGLETCHYEGPNENNIIFSYSYNNLDSNVVTQRIRSLVFRVDSIFDSVYIDTNMLFLREYYNNRNDSTANWREYRILHRGLPDRKVTVLYRSVDTREDFETHDDWVGRLEDCHAEPFE